MEELKFFISKSNDPSINLAFEEYLINHKIKCLYLWINEPTIVMGRNQNPYKECNLNKIKEDDIHLERRNSGGGTVYHDLGNLNFTLITSKYEGVIEDNFNLIIKVLKRLNLDAKINGRNDLTINDKKISGSAFYEIQDVYLHHGTILVDVNLNKMNDYLNPDKLKLISKGITSVKSRVINLKSINEDVTIDKVIDSFIDTFNLDPIYVTKDELIENLEINTLINKYNSYSWTLGETIEYNISFKDKFKCGLIGAYFNIDEGKIKEAKFETDSIINDNFNLLSKELINKEFNKEVVTSVINRVIINEEIKLDLIKLIKIY